MEDFFACEFEMMRAQGLKIYFQVPVFSQQSKHAKIGKGYCFSDLTILISLPPLCVCLWWVVSF
jgi:hypothetical protein